MSDTDFSAREVLRDRQSRSIDYYPVLAALIGEKESLFLSAIESRICRIVWQVEQGEVLDPKYSRMGEDGTPWTRSSAGNMNYYYFPGWGRATVRRIQKKLIDDGFLIAEWGNQDPENNLGKWLRINYSALNGVTLSNLPERIEKLKALRKKAAAARLNPPDQNDQGPPDQNDQGPPDQNDQGPPDQNDQAPLIKMINQTNIYSSLDNPLEKTTNIFSQSGEIEKYSEGFLLLWDSWPWRKPEGLKIRAAMRWNEVFCDRPPNLHDMHIALQNLKTINLAPGRRKKIDLLDFYISYVDYLEMPGRKKANPENTFSIRVTLESTIRQHFPSVLKSNMNLLPAAQALAIELNNNPEAIEILSEVFDYGAKNSFWANYIVSPGDLTGRRVHGKLAIYSLIVQYQASLADKTTKKVDLYE